nr:MAG TPA: hypothetical protein [Bacteriophage sp.]
MTYGDSMFLSIKVFNGLRTYILILLLSTVGFTL